MLKRPELLICQQTSRHKGRSPASTQKSLWMASDSVLEAWKQFGETSNIGGVGGAGHDQCRRPLRSLKIFKLQAVAMPAKRLFLMIAWMPQLPSTTCVTPKSTPMDMSEIASSSVSPLVVIRKIRILRNASRSARSIEDFE